MICVMPFVAFALLNTVIAVPPKHEEHRRLLSSLIAEDVQTANVSFKDFLEPPAFTVPAKLYPLKGISPNQWLMPEVFKRQVVCKNYCGPTQSAPGLYCYCGQQCCGTTRCCITASGEACCTIGLCCNTASGQVCCGGTCCLNGATCNANTACAFKTVVVSIVATSTTVVYNDISFTVTAVGGTVTLTSTLSSVTVVTISSADVATVIATATVTAAAGRLARDLLPADVAEQPLQTLTPALYIHNTQPGQGALAPQITTFPLVTDHLEKRQTSFVSTITATISTITVASTSTRLVTTTVAGRATTTYFTTVWQTVTSVMNAKTTMTSTSTLTFTPGVTPNNVATLTIAPGGDGGNSGSNTNGANDTPNQIGPKKSLSTGAQAGIGVGTAGGSLIICIILSFFFWRRRKTRLERNQEMIDNAVTSAMAAQQAQNSPQQQQYHDGKHLSTATNSNASPHPYSPTPPLHTPQPGYVYPPPAGHGQQSIYNNQGVIELQDSGMDPHNQFRHSAPTYGGSEVAGSPVERFELQQFSSPAPVHSGPYSDVPHSGGYTTSGRNQFQRAYSDLPEVRTSDLPGMRRQ